MNKNTLKNALIKMGILVFTFIIPFRLSYAAFTFEPAWTDSESQIVFFQNDVPESHTYYYFPKFHVIPYTGGSDDYFDKKSCRSFPLFSKYYNYTFHILKTMDLDVLRRAQTALGPQSLFLEVPISRFEHIASSLDHLPYASVTVSPSEGSGPSFQEQFYVTFSVWKDDVNRFEGFLNNSVGLPLEFTVTIPGAQITFDGFIEFNAKDLYTGLSEELAKLGRTPTPDDVRHILLNLRNTSPGIWTIYQRKNPSFSDRANQVEVIFLKASEILKNYYFNINESGGLVYKRETDLGQSVSLRLSDAILTEFKDIPFKFSIRLPAGEHHETPPPQNN